MSTLTVQNLRGVSPTNLISVASGHSLYYPGGLVQVQQTIYDVRSSYANINTWTDHPGLSVNITPKYSTSKVLIRSMVQFSTAGATTVNCRFVRNGTAICLGTTASNAQGSFRGISSSTAWCGVATGEFLDSPATTSTCTYKIQFLPYAADARTVVFNNSIDGSNFDACTVTSSITVMEIAQ
jgi:hypothetical protein